MPRHPKKSTPTPPPVEIVAGSWLLKAFAVVGIAALICTYATLCALFYRGQWQIVLHPVRTTGPAPNNLIHFSSEATGQPQLVGEWLPAMASNRYSELTVLFLPGGDGTSASFSATQTALRQIGLNVFAFDYRGYGRSANIHPSQQRMTQDSEAAWIYLTSTRKIPASTILPYGVGVGASLAAHLASIHSQVPAVVIDAPYADLGEMIRRDSRFRFLPVSLLFHEDFPLRAALASMQRPKLLITHDQAQEPESFRSAAAPKVTVTLPAVPDAAFAQAILPFLDQVVPVSSPTPSQK